MSRSFQPAAVFGDHMVLGRNRVIRIFGDAADGACVRAEMAGHAARATAAGGRFSVALPPMPAGGPYTLLVTDGLSAFTYSDVYVGEVYLAGGQSNMEMRLAAAKDGPLLARQTDLPLLRFYYAARNPWLDDAALANERRSRWQAATPGACAAMSAVAFHFASRLQKALGIAVGVVDANWGGTSAACWIPEAELARTAEGQAVLAERDQRAAGLTPAQQEEALADHEQGLNVWNSNIEATRRAEPGISMLLLFERFGPCPWNPPPFGRSPFRPAGLVETMLARLAPYPLTGFLYYQGEEDTRHPALYCALMTSLIQSWRALFRGDDLPFLFAQLPMFHNSYEPDTGNWAELRLAQARVQGAMRGCEMAVLIDCGELDEIHPTDKQPVGERLYRLALRHVYGQAIEADGPRAVCAAPDGGGLRVWLTAPVHSEDQPALFEVAGPDGVFCPADAALEGASVLLTSPRVAEPRSARYAWVNYGVVNIFGSGGLPLAQFLLEV